MNTISMADTQYAQPPEFDRLQDSEDD